MRATERFVNRRGMAQSMHVPIVMRSRHSSAEARGARRRSRAPEDERAAPLRHALDVAIASDPGLTRWRAGARATLTAIASSAVLVPLAHFRRKPATLALAGIVVAIMAAARVYDETPRAQRITMGSPSP